MLAQNSMLMNRYIVMIFVSMLFAQVKAQMKWNQQYQTYINQYKDLAIEEMMRYHIPASITLAQGLFESRAGQSDLVLRGNNHFGIKCHGWDGASIFHDDDETDECFRSYDNALESYEDHSKFLSNNSRYSILFNLKNTDYRGWANGLKDCGYATNYQYASKIIQIIELYKLYEYDKVRSYDKFMAERSGKDKPFFVGQQLHPIHIYNKNYYLLAREGDTFRSIGKEVDISYHAIAKYNERDKNDTLQEGDIVYLKKKQKKAEKIYKKCLHSVKANESMYTISQKYGIRLKSLYKKNKLSTEYQIRIGDKIKVY